MLIQNTIHQINFIVNPEIIETHQCFSFWKKWKKLFSIFNKVQWNFYEYVYWIWSNINIKYWIKHCNVKLSRSQPEKIKISNKKKQAKITLSLSINKIGNTNETSDFPHTLLLTDRKIENFCKVFTNHSSAGVKLSKIQISKITHSGGFLGKFLELLLKTCFPLAKSPLILLAKSVLIPLRLTVAAEALVAFGEIHKNMLVSIYH